MGLLQRMSSGGRWRKEPFNVRELEHTLGSPFMLIMASQEATRDLQRMAYDDLGEMAPYGHIMRITHLEPFRVRGYSIGDLKSAVFSNGVTVTRTIPNKDTFLFYIFVPHEVSFEERLAVLTGTIADYDGVTAKVGQKYAMPVMVDLQSVVEYKSETLFSCHPLDGLAVLAQALK